MSTYRLHPETSQRQHLVRVVIAVVSALLLLASLLMWNSRQYSLLSVQTASMAPIVEPGDAVMLRKVSAQEVQPGDVISYRSEQAQNVSVTHRVIDRLPDGRLVTQGDENATPDAPVNPSQIIGKAEMRFENAGFALDFARSMPGLIALVYLPSLILVLIELRRLVAYFQPAYRHYSTQ